MGAEMADPLRRLLAERPALLLDGGMGTGLFRRGLVSGDSPEEWNLVYPERVCDVHREFVDAGSDILLTNSFGANAVRLKLHGLEARVAELNAAAVACARRAAAGAGREILVAGSVGPTGMIVTDSADEAAEVRAAFAGQIAALQAAGADMVWIETMSSKEEIQIAASAAIAAGIPYVGTMTFDTVGFTMMGVSPADAYRVLGAQPVAPMAIGANCGLGAAENAVSIWQMAKVFRDGDVIVAKANNGVPEFRDGAFQYSGTPELMAQYCHLVLNLGARLVGGCCGTDGASLRAMRAVIDGFDAAARQAPGYDDIVRCLGAPFVQRPEHTPPGRRNRKNRRRSG